MKNTKNFASRWGFILASVGSAVGMANVWGFPNKLGSNGGAFAPFILTVDRLGWVCYLLTAIHSH